MTFFNFFFNERSEIMFSYPLISFYLYKPKTLKKKEKKINLAINQNKREREKKKVHHIDQTIE